MLSFAKLILSMIDKGVCYFRVIKHVQDTSSLKITNFFMKSFFFNDRKQLVSSCEPHSGNMYIVSDKDFFEKN